MTMTKIKANRDSEKTTKPSAALGDEIADLLRKRPSEAWWLPALITFAAALIQAAREAAAAKDRLSALPAALLRRAGQALQIADKRLLGTGKSLLTLGELHGIPRRAASAAMWLARRVSAKAVVGLTVGEVRKQLGVKKSITDNDRIDDDRPEITKHGIDSAAPTCDELRQHADKASWPLEWIELMLTRHQVSLDNAEDFLVSLDCVYCAVLRIARTIEQQGWLHPALAKVTGRGPRRRAARRARKGVAPWDVVDVAPEGQGAKASRKQKRRPPARE
jgi:hypothetical protein